MGQLTVFEVLLICFTTVCAVALHAESKVCAEGGAIA
jgi:hypothetical protein